MNLRGAALAVLALGCGTGDAAGQAQCLRYEPATVELQGTFATEQRYGPPNYGETPATDQRALIRLLKLSKPVDVCADSTAEVNTESFQGVAEVQLLFLGEQQAHDALLNKDVVVTGSLSEAQTGHQYTKVVLTVKSIRSR